MKKVIKLTESDLARIVRRVIKEQEQNNIISPDMFTTLTNEASAGRLYQGFDKNEPYYYFQMQDVYKPENGQFKVNVYRPEFKEGGNSFQFALYGEMTVRFDKSGKWTTSFQPSGIQFTGLFDDLFYAEYGIEMAKIVEYLNYYAEKNPSFQAVLDKSKVDNVFNRITDQNVKALYGAMGLNVTRTTTTSNNPRG